MLRPQVVTTAAPPPLAQRWGRGHRCWWEQLPQFRGREGCGSSRLSSSPPRRGHLAAAGPASLGPLGWGAGLADRSGRQRGGGSGTSLRPCVPMSHSCGAHSQPRIRTSAARGGRPHKGPLCSAVTDGRPFIAEANLLAATSRLHSALPTGRTMPRWPFEWTLPPTVPHSRRWEPLGTLSAGRRGRGETARRLRRRPAFLA